MTTSVADHAPTTTLETAPRQTSRRPQPLAGFWTLLRFIARRDRVVASVWIASAVGIIAASAGSVIGLYSTPAQLQEYADVALADAALQAVAGPGYGLANNPTQGAVVMNEVLVYTFVGVALMCIFLMIRHTRAEEEPDRAELVRAAPVGRHAILAAASVWVAAIDLVVTTGATVALVAFGLPTTGAIAYGAAAAGVGLAFIGVAAVSAQVASSARAARSSAALVLGASFLLRAVADLGTRWVVWLSPLGWAQSIRAYANERWWVLAPLLLAAVGLLVVAVVFAGHRDLNAGFFKQRPGPATAHPRLRSPLAMALRLQRTSIIGWAIGLGITGFFFGIVSDQADKLLENDTIAEILSQAGEGTPTESFLATMVLMIALIAGGFAVSSVLRQRSEETDGRADPVLATPTGRRQWSLSFLAVAIGGSALVVMISALMIGIGNTVEAGDGGNILPLLGASTTMVPALAVLVALAVALSGFRPKWAPVAWAGVVVSTVVGFLGETLNLPQWTRDLSPFEPVPGVPAASFELLPLVVLTLVAVGLTTFGQWAFSRRDIG